MPRPSPIRRARPAALLAAAALALGGCAEMHRGAEAVGRVAGASAPAAQPDAAPPRPDVRTVRPRGAPRRAPDEDAADRAPPGTAVAGAVPSPRQIFDFHPPGSSPEGWRQPFVIDASDGPLAADVRRSAAELRQFLADQKAGAAGRDAPGTVRRRCGESEVANHVAGCGPAAPRAAAAAAPDGPAPR